MSKQMKFDYYKQISNNDEVQTTLNDLLDIAEQNGMGRDHALKLLKDLQIGEIYFGDIHLWVEEAMYY